MDNTKAYIDGFGGELGENPDYPVADWQDEVANGDTRKGYWDWVIAQVDLDSAISAALN